MNVRHALIADLRDFSHRVAISTTSHLDRVLADARDPGNPYPVTRDLMDLSDAKVTLLLDAMRLYTTQHSKHMSDAEQMDCAEVLGQLCVLAKS